MDNIIRTRHLINAVSKQPFLVWNTIDSSDDNDDENSFTFQLPSYGEFDEIQTYTQVQARSFSKLQSAFIERESKKEGVAVIDVFDIDERIQQTKKYMDDKSIVTIINPTFEYVVKDHRVVITPTIYNKVDKKLSNLKLSTSTKRNDFLKISFEYEVLKKLDIQVEKATLFILATKAYKKGEFDFYETEFLNRSKGARSNSYAKQTLAFNEMQYAKVGRGLNAKGEYFETETIIEILENRILAPETKTKDAVLLPNLDSTIDRAILDKSFNTLEPVSDADITPFSDNKLLKDILEKTNSNYVGWNGNVLPMQRIIDNDFTGLPVYKKIKELIDKPLLKEEAVFEFVSGLHKRVVWYDFEAFSLPYAAMNNTLPYQQIVSQVSVIVTLENNELDVNNIVIDPLTASLEDFITIIESIYDEEADHYVVYNQGYENSRLKEMVTLLSHANHPRTEEMREKISTIIELTVDLEKLFQCSKNKLPKILLPELKGRSSIKVVEKYATSNFPNLVAKVGVKEYKELDIQHGMMAMETANKRAMDIIGDNEWSEIVPKLEEYCENDVRAMILVYRLVEELLNSRVKGLISI